MMAWSAIAIGQCGLKNKAQFYATRALLGLWEGYVFEVYNFIPVCSSRLRSFFSLQWFHCRHNPLLELLFHSKRADDSSVFLLGFFDYE